MTVYAISDLHLPAGKNKPMDIFGPHWERHFERISESWRERVGEDDLVLLPGDISWAMQLDDARQDLCAIGALPGKKIITRGNHDYWWSSISRVREALPENMYALQNDSIRINNVVICGTRGWILPMDGVDADDIKIFRRECARLRLSLDSAVKKTQPGDTLVCMLHYPPLTDSLRSTAMTEILREYSVSHVVYGHLHGPALCGAFRGEDGGIRYHQVSSDGLDFKIHTVISV